MNTDKEREAAIDKLLEDRFGLGRYNELPESIIAEMIGAGYDVASAASAERIEALTGALRALVTAIEVEQVDPSNEGRYVPMQTEIALDEARLALGKDATTTTV